MRLAVCSVDTCANTTVIARGYCWKHLQRFYRHMELEKTEYPIEYVGEVARIPLSRYSNQQYILVDRDKASLFTPGYIISVPYRNSKGTHYSVRLIVEGKHRYFSLPAFLCPKRFVKWDRVVCKNGNLTDYTSQNLSHWDIVGAFDPKTKKYITYHTGYKKYYFIFHCTLYSSREREKVVAMRNSFLAYLHTHPNYHPRLSKKEVQTIYREYRGREA